MTKVVLGKGLEALIPTPSATEGNKRFRILPLEHLAPNPMQPRRDFDDHSLHDLAESIRINGVIQPLVVQQSDTGYTIVAGERRYRAARLAGLEEVPVVVMDELDDARKLELALVENLQREDLNPMEVSEAYRTLVDKCDLTQNQLAERVGKSRAAVANLLRLLSLPDIIKNMIRGGRLTEGHARAILALGSEQEMLDMAQRIVSDSLSVRRVEQEATKKRGRRLVPKRKNPLLDEAESFLRQCLGTSVKIIPGLKRGRIEIEYYGNDDLNRVLDLFRKIES